MAYRSVDSGQEPNLVPKRGVAEVEQGQGTIVRGPLRLCSHYGLLVATQSGWGFVNLG